MKRKIFDVVKLITGNMATILQIDGNSYKVEVVDKDGKIQGIEIIEEDEIQETIISK